MVCGLFQARISTETLHAAELFDLQHAHSSGASRITWVIVSISSLTRCITRRGAHSVRDACIDTALSGYEEAAIAGLCGQDALEVAISAMRRIDLDTPVEQLVQNAKTDR